MKKSLRCDFFGGNYNLDVWYASETVHRTVSEERLNKDDVLIVGENSCFPPHPFSAFERFDCAPARRVAALRAEYSRWRAKCEGFALTLPLPFVSKRKRKPIADAVVSM